MDTFPIVHKFPMHWGEMDALGHANHTRFLVWMETARIKLFEATGLMGTNGIGPILAKVDLDYRKPVHFPATLICGVKVSKIGGKSFTLEYAIAHQSTPSDWLAHGSTVIVLYDYKTAQSVTIPTKIREALEKHIGA